MDLVLELELVPVLLRVSVHLGFCVWELSLMKNKIWVYLKVKINAIKRMMIKSVPTPATILYSSLRINVFVSFKSIKQI